MLNSIKEHYHWISPTVCPSALINIPFSDETGRPHVNSPSFDWLMQCMFWVDWTTRCTTITSHCVLHVKATWISLSTKPLLTKYSLAVDVIWLPTSLNKYLFSHYRWFSEGSDHWITEVLERKKDECDLLDVNCSVLVFWCSKSKWQKY